MIRENKRKREKRKEKKRKEKILSMIIVLDTKST
jgi:hypothetical protein